ncbi:ATP-binding Cassette (ABC) Superfamily [Pseudoloma neurophilia]|uniref:ATP-binding Cassette (ABC) Superfamily n=1 Tax=Pseudoloma neurophilia TaxID=146866 RepID=A0A0R0M0P8_9MICR|nr:ATP-binding Cassette (ABC) Superfamily [Pseudoloma neurophilia]
MNSQTITDFYNSNVLEWVQLSYEVEKSKPGADDQNITLIYDSFGMMGPGLLAIIGPSGSGKTTLLNTLSGHIGSNCKTRGSVTLNGEERTPMEWMNNVGYADPNEIVFKNLTVFDTLKYAAEFRLKSGANIDNKIEEMLKGLDIVDITYQKMSALSQSEQKRVMIAVELISEPKILFLDEPTSGLDSNTSGKLLSFLKSLSHKGMIILITIHQPSEVMLGEFDKIILLSRGKTVFFGDLKDCEPYLINNQFEKKEGETFSDFMMRILDTEKKENNEFISRLDKMANEMKNIHSTYIKNKDHYMGQTNKNIVFCENKINMRHVLHIFKRKFKTRKLSKLRNIVIIIFNLIFNFIMTGFLCSANSACSSHKTPKKQNINNNNSKKVIYTEYFFLITDYENELLFSIQTMGMLITSTLFSSDAFSDEMDVIKRELNVATYSLVSYTLATVIFELVMTAFNLPFFCIALYFITLKVYNPCLIIFLNLLILISLIQFNLSFIPIGYRSTSIYQKKFFKTFGVFISCIFSIIVPSAIFQHYKSGYGGNWLYFLFNFLCPAYSSFFLCFSLLLEAHATVSFVSSDNVRLKKLIGECLTFFEINPKFGILLLVAWVFVSFFMIVKILNRSISPMIRLKLHA